MSQNRKIVPLLFLAGSLGCANNAAPAEQAAPDGSRAHTPADMPRLTPAEVQPLVQRGEAMLVCAYDSDEKFERTRLAGAIALSALEQKRPSLTKDQLIVFYCS